MAFEIKIVSKNGTEFESEVDSVTLPAKDGYITLVQNKSDQIYLRSNNAKGAV